MTLNDIRKQPWWQRLSDMRVLLGLWLFVGLISALTKLNAHNNFDIYRYVYHHTVEGVNLFLPDTAYGDTNHYGPFFSLVVAPFALCPVSLGLVLWCTALAMLLFWTVRCSTLTRRQQVFVLWFCAHELLTALFMQQFNVATAALILMSWWLVEKEKDGWAALCIVIGTAVKLYGIVGLAFFFFSRHKGRFILGLLLSTAIVLVLPMLISSPQYQLTQYAEWAKSLASKNGENAGSLMQNISLLGMAHRITGCHSFSDLWLIVPGLALFAAGYFRIRQWGNAAFRQTVTASLLMFVCLFSTGTESSGYIIALIGVSIWYTASPWQRSRLDLGLLIFCFILTSFSPSDLFPRYLRETYVIPYALKALPVTLIWLKLSYELLTQDYKTEVIGS